MAYRTERGTRIRRILKLEEEIQQLRSHIKGPSSFITQTNTNPGEGNCGEACLATLLNRPLDSIHIEWGQEEHWLYDLRDWVANQGYHLCVLDDWPFLYAGPLMISGPGPRGRNHMVVGQCGKIIHDPHPDGGGLLEHEAYYVLALGSVAPKDKT